MQAWRVLATLGAVLLAVPTVAAQTVPLAETVKAGDCFRVRLDMSLRGDIHVRKDAGNTTLPLEATAQHEFSERALVVNGPLLDKSARLYELAKALIKVNGSESERTLRGERRLLVAQRYKDEGLVYSPAGALLRDELDLTQHFDTLSLPGLLPGKDVAVGETWKLGEAAVLGLCGFEALTEPALTGKLESVDGGAAVFSIKGTASGIECGALVKLTIDATGKFDVAAKRIIGLDWTQQDERDMGPVSPATTVKTTWKVQRSAIAEPEGLKETALVSVPDTFEPPQSLTALDYRDPKGRFSMLHGRDWHMVGQTDGHAVFRLVERGDFVAQVTLTPWTSEEKGKHISPEEFKRQINESPGWEPESELQAGEVSNENGRWVYRVSMLGKLDGVDVLQNFYLVAGPGGEQVVAAFTMTPKEADKLGARDLSFVGGLEVPAAKK
jgi:hypothetical protein